jgi:glycosyltransferase involved in cell wall biosynthesis
MDECGDKAVKILHVDVNGWVYGVQRYVINFCKKMNNIDGYNTIVVGPSEEYRKTLKKEKIYTIPLQEKWKKIDTDHKGWIRLYRIIRKERPHVIHCHGTKDNIITKIIGLLLRIPVVPIYHCNHKVYDSEERCGNLRRRVYELIYLDTLERVTSFFSRKNIAVSHAVKENIRGFGIPDMKIEVIHSGVWIDDSASRREKQNGINGRIKILSISRIEENKGILDIISAAKILKEDGRNFEINFVGDGPLVSECGQLVNKYGLNDEIKFLGYLKNTREIYLKSDIFISASYSEGFPLTIVEAMACGLPVVVTGVGGVPEIVDNKVNGLIVDRGNPEQLRKALLFMMKSSKLRREYGRKGREKVVAKFSMDRMIAQYISLYDTILGKTVS